MECELQLLLPRAKLNSLEHPDSCSFLCCCPPVSDRPQGACVAAVCSPPALVQVSVISWSLQHRYPLSQHRHTQGSPCPGCVLGRALQGNPRRYQDQSLILGLQLPLVMGFSLLQLAADTPVEADAPSWLLTSHSRAAIWE